MTAAFKPTHEFVLESGERVRVVVEFRFDYVAFEEDGTAWYTVMSAESLWWSCRTRGVSKVAEVIKLDNG